MPQSDGTTKNRPTIILREMPPFRDVLVCGVSTQLHQEVKGFDEVITPIDSDFAENSLLGKSLIRLGFLTYNAPCCYMRDFIKRCEYTFQSLRYKQCGY